MPRKQLSKRGRPNPITIGLLQRAYGAAVRAKGDLPPDILAKIDRMHELRADAKGKIADTKTGEEIVALAKKLFPYTHFNVDAVDWDNEWNAETRELRHNGVVVRLGDY